MTVAAGPIGVAVEVGADAVEEEAETEEQKQGLRVGGILAGSAKYHYDFAAAAVVVVAVVAVDSPHDPSRVSSSVSQRPSLSSGVVVGSRFPLTVSSNSRRQRVS